MDRRDFSYWRSYFWNAWRFECYLFATGLERGTSLFDGLEGLDGSVFHMISISNYELCLKINQIRL